MYRAVNGGDDFVFLELNKAGQDIDSVKVEDLIGRRVTEVFPGVQEFGLLEVLARVHRTGSPERFPVSMYKDNRITGFRDNQVFKLPSGEVVAVYTDETEHVQVREMLRKNLERYRSIFAMAPLMITSVDAAGIIRECNRLATRVLGYQPEELIGQSMGAIIHPDDMDKAQRSLAEILSKGYSWDKEYRMVHKSGCVKEVVINSAAVADEKDRFVATICLIEDVTEKVRAEREATRARKDLESQRALSIHSDRLRSLGELAASIAHELNQPLSAARGRAEHMLTGMERDWDITQQQQQEYLREIIDHSDRMAHVIEHIRLFSREAGKPTRVPFHVGKVVQDAVELVRAQFRVRDIDLKVDGDDSAPVVMGNAYSLEELVLNLLNNARDAVEERAVADPQFTNGAVKIRFGPAHSGPGRMILTVSDNGCGIPETALPHIFEPFFTTKDVGKGTGLGLSVSRRIAEQMGGTLALRDTGSHGTVFEISLPVSETDGGEE